MWELPVHHKGDRSPPFASTPWVATDDTDEWRMSLPGWEEISALKPMLVHLGFGWNTCYGYTVKWLIKYIDP